MRSRQPFAILLAAMLLLSSCRSGGTSPNDPLGRTLIDAKPTGYELVGAPATGPMDLDEAATSTEASQSRLRRQLGTTGFQGGYAKVWKKDQDFVAVLVYDFLSHKRAEGLVTFMSKQLADKRSAATFKVRKIPGAKGSILNARNARGVSLFCQLAWFSASTRAYGVRVCASTPNSPAYAIDLAQRQYTRAR